MRGSTTAASQQRNYSIGQSGRMYTHAQCSSWFTLRLHWQYVSFRPVMITVADAAHKERTDVGDGKGASRRSTHWTNARKPHAVLSPFCAFSPSLSLLRVQLSNTDKERNRPGSPQYLQADDNSAASYSICRLYRSTTALVRESH